MEELDLKDLLSIFWEKKYYIVLITAIFVLIGLLYSYIYLVPMYESYTTLVLTKTNSNDSITEEEESITQTDITLNQKLVSTYSELIKSKSVLRQVINNLNINELDEEDLRKHISVSSVKDTEIIEITVENENPEYAAKIAYEIAIVFTEKVDEFYNINNVNIVDVAESSTIPSNINHIKDLIIFAFIGIIISSVYILISNMLDTTIKTVEDVEKCSGLLVLAQIPEYDYNKIGGKK